MESTVKVKRSKFGSVNPAAIALVIVLVFICVLGIVFGAELGSAAKKLDEKKYELVSNELGVNKKNIIIDNSISDDYVKVSTDKGSYKVIFKNENDLDKISISNIVKE
ncbi:hypothetical protein MOD96_01880 [Bacillus sp. S17B2]|uniref:hypothetical protein n=1 Tax=Bacillus sp. S17B2 TaxID=2918907 RepID=UPI00227FFCC2|nr:hypothetical protein [Bacillus sp. S17B2]